MCIWLMHRSPSRGFQAWQASILRLPRIQSILSVLPSGAVRIFGPVSVSSFSPFSSWVLVCLCFMRPSRTRLVPLRLSRNLLCQIRVLWQCNKVSAGRVDVFGRKLWEILSLCWNFWMNYLPEVSWFELTHVGRLILRNPN